jgi:type IV pilus assembly protein PilP
MNMNRTAQVFFVLLTVASLTACVRGTSEIEKRVAEVKAQPPPPLEPLPVMKQFEQFEYAAQGLRDPFSQPVPDRNTSGSGPRPDQNRPKQALEAFPLDSLNMGGTIGGARALSGLVVAPDKVVYRVRPGNYLGQNDGRVTAIYDDRIEIVELVPDGAGGWIERPAKIALEDN